MAFRGRVGHSTPPDGLVVAHQAGVAQGGCVELVGERMEMASLDHQQLRRQVAVWGPVVDLVAERRAGVIESDEARRRPAGWRRSVPGRPWRPALRFRTASRLRVTRHAGLDDHPVVAASGDDLAWRTGMPATELVVIVFSLSVTA